MFQKLIEIFNFIEHVFREHATKGYNQTADFTINNNTRVNLKYNNLRHL